ncbi:MAG: metallophosphoesterase [Clostridia bacterium]|nr:metallophosphoesterase [Clostridia bacterium]
MAEKLRFYHLTDLHYNSGSGKTDSDMRRAISGAFDLLIDDKETEIILISGDLTDNGDIESHRAVIKELERLVAAGKKVYVTFATHDWYWNQDKITRKQLRELYAPYGFEQAYDEFESYSYAVKLCDGWRLLALNDDGDGRNFCGASDEELQWIKKLLDDAKAAGDRVIAMVHHPVLPPNPIYPLVSDRDMYGGYRKAGPFLCENGLKYLFVGHTHMQDIRFIEAGGNRMYQVNTGSITQYTSVMRYVEECDKGLDVKSVYIDKKYCEIDGRSVSEFLVDDLKEMLTGAVYAMGYDIEKFAGVCVGMSMDYNTVIKLKKLILPVGKFIYGLTFGKAARLLLCSNRLPKEAKNIKIVDVVAEAGGRIFRGNENLSPDTPEYQGFTLIADRLKPVIRLFKKDLDPVKLVQSIIYDDGPDDENAVLYERGEYTNV